MNDTIKHELLRHYLQLFILKIIAVKKPAQEPSGLFRTYWQKFDTLIPKNIIIYITCLAKQNQTGSYTQVRVEL